MSYSVQETSVDGGQPIELYTFTLGGTEYRFSNHEDDIVVAGQTYLAESISRTALESTAEAKQNQVSISVPFDNVFAKLFVGTIPGERPEVTIQQMHRTDVAEEVITVFLGFVSTVAFQQNVNTATINCRPVLSAAQRPIPRHTYQRGCNHMLYDDRCTLLEANFTDAGTVSVTGNRTVTVTGLPSGNLSGDYYEAGQIEFGSERRMIIAQSSNVFTVLLDFAEDPTGQSVNVIAGCKLRFATDCQTKFSNEINYGGWPFIPSRTIFGGLGLT